MSYGVLYNTKKSQFHFQGLSEFLFLFSFNKEQRRDITHLRDYFLEDSLRRLHVNKSYWWGGNVRPMVMECEASRETDKREIPSLNRDIIWCSMLHAKQKRDEAERGTPWRELGYYFVRYLECFRRWKVKFSKWLEIPNHSKWMILALKLYIERRESAKSWDDWKIKSSWRRWRRSWTFKR